MGVDFVEHWEIDVLERLDTHTATILTTVRERVQAPRPTSSNVDFARGGRGCSVQRSQRLGVDEQSLSVHGP